MELTPCPVTAPVDPTIPPIWPLVQRSRVKFALRCRAGQRDPSSTCMPTSPDNALSRAIHGLS